MSAKRDAGAIKLLGGRLCLDFVNTVHCYGCNDIGEYLNNYQDLIAWSRHVGTMSSDEAKRLAVQSIEYRSQAKRLHLRAIELREIIYSIFCSILEGAPPAKKNLTAFNNYLSEMMALSHIVKTPDGFEWDMSVNKTGLDWILNPVIRSTADLLISEEWRKIKKCADPTCGWLFLDVSRNHSRRWCDMRACGNRAKASRFYKKKKKTQSAKPSLQAPRRPSRTKSGIRRHLL
ncbi:MAG: CGNR zinc finger domain-containing protein [Desulfobacterales bacterium]